MRALVTGGGGFLGRYIVEKLVARGIETRTFNRRERPELEKLGVEQVLGDLRSFEDVEKACDGCEVVYHAAAFPSVVIDPRPYYETHVVGTKNVVAACLKKKARKLVYTSTQCVCNTLDSQEGVNESVPFPSQYLGWYQMTKAVGEQMVRAANYAPWTDDYDFGGLDLSESNYRTFRPNLEVHTPKRDAEREDALTTVALRPHLIWGPRDVHLMPRLFQRARAGKLSRVGDGTNMLATIYVENAADAHLLAAEALKPGSSVPGSVYYISQERPLNCWKWIDEILAILDVPPVKKSISFKTAYRVGTVMEKIWALAGFKTEPIMTKFLAAQLSRSYWFDTTRAKNELGFEPKISIEEGMKRLAEDLKARKL